MRRTTFYIRLASMLALLFWSAGLWADPVDPFPDVNSHDFYGNMTVAVKVLKGNNALEDVVVAVYCGDQIRGKGTPSDPNRPGVAYLTVYGNSTGDKIFYKIFVESENRTYEIDAGQTYIFNGSIGSPKTPYVIDIHEDKKLTFEGDEGIIANGAYDQSGNIAYAQPGGIITLVPPTGYSIASASYNDGSEHEIIPVNGVYSFTMPFEEVTVTTALKKMFSNADISVSISSETYTGVRLTPTIVVKDGESKTLVENKDYSVSLPDDCTNAGEHIVNITGMGVYDGTLTDTLRITPRPVVVTTGSGSKEYDGVALTSSEISITGLVSGESVTITASGSQTEVGTSQNGYVLDWGSTESGNYSLTENLGTLTVSASTSSVVLTASSSSKVYDGTALTNDTVSASGLPSGFTLSATASGSQTVVGSSANVVNDGYVILNPDGADRTSNFTNVSKVNGTLTVTAKVTIYGALTITEDENGKSATINADQNVPLDISDDVVVKSVDFNRTFIPGCPSTVMLPFSYECNGNEGGIFYEFVKVIKEGDDWVVAMQEPGVGVNSATILDANTPYVFMPTGDRLNLTNIPSEGVTLSTLDGPEEITDGYWSFRGTYAALTCGKDFSNDVNVYGFTSIDKREYEHYVEAGQFVLADDDMVFSPFQAYLTCSTFIGTDDIPNQITVRLYDKNGMLTAIGEISIGTDDITIDVWYDLSGHRLDGEPTRKGIYLHNNRKVMIR